MTHDNVTDIERRLDKLHANRAVDGLWCNVHPNDMLAIFAALKDLATLRKQLENAREALRTINIEAEREKGHWQHLKRVIAVHATEALKGPQ